MSSSQSDAGREEVTRLVEEGGYIAGAAHHGEVFELTKVA